MRTIIIALNNNTVGDIIDYWVARTIKLGDEPPLKIHF